MDYRVSLEFITVWGKPQLGCFTQSLGIAADCGTDRTQNISLWMQRDPGRFANTGKTGLANFKLDLHLLDWLRDLLRMPEEELIRIAGLDAVLVLRVIALRSGGHHCLDNQLNANFVVKKSPCD
jgi:hypothetical protein